MSTPDQEDRLIPLDEERCAAIEAVFEKVAEHREQRRLSQMFAAQMARRETKYDPWITWR